MPKAGGGFEYEYFIKDHLGNTRLTVQDSSGIAAIKQEDHYYPFGMVMNGLSNPKFELRDKDTKNDYLYNGKVVAERKSRPIGKFQDELGLDWYDYGARFYDAQIGRWMSVDPLAEKNRRWSPYSFCKDDPLNRVDPDGMDDFTLVDGKVTRIKGTKDKKDRIIKTDENGKPKLKGQGLLGFMVRQSEKGKFKTEIGGIERGILKTGQDFKNKDEIISVGGGGPSVAGVKSFTLKLSEHIGKEIKGFSYSSDASGVITDMLLTKYKANKLESSYGEPSELGRKYGDNNYSNNIFEQFHTHPDGKLGATESDPEQSKDVEKLQIEKRLMPNARFIILYRIRGQKEPGEYSYTHEYRPKK